ncbi:MAG TPA: hypothetical protein VFQ38_01335 [Longimicrobiales bacterium]|nr:hypothetical protein [Longimicrobiales bacterium]
MNPTSSPGRCPYCGNDIVLSAGDDGRFLCAGALGCNASWAGAPAAPPQAQAA